MESLISSQESITMTATTTEPQGLTHYSRFVLFGLVLPLLFIAGVQLFILAEQTETYFAWTFAAPFSASFMGAGYWAAMLHAYSGSRASSWATVRTSLPAALTATTLLTITTFIHLDKFHFDSPLFITRFVTWVWIVVYVTVPFILFAAWVIQSRLLGSDVKGRHPLRAWMRGEYILMAVFALVCGLGLFIAPTAMSSIWPWEITPLAGRAISSWLTAFGMACASLALENDIKHGAGTASSLFAFCVLQLIVIARYSSAIDWGKPLSSAYILFLVLGMLLSGANLLANRILSKK
jgi:hypothetical protein